MFANRYMACTIEKMDHKGYIMQSEVASTAATTDTP